MAIRYPKDALEAKDASDGADFAIGEWEVMFEGSDVVLFAAGPMVYTAIQAALTLNSRGISAGVVDARFIKPLDEKILIKQCASARLVAVIEENTVIGGLGEAIAHALADHGIQKPLELFGAADRFVSHARVSRQREMNGLTASAICERIETKLQTIEEGAQ